MTEILKKQRCWGLLLLLAGLLWLSAARPYAEPFGLPIPLDKKRLASVREKGRQHDQKAAPGLVAVLTEVPAANTDLGLAAIHSLAQLGAEEALPDIDAYAAAQKVPGINFPDERTVNYIKVARARLVAEAGARDLKDEPQKTAAKIAHLCQELDLSVAEINKAAAVNQARQTPFSHPPVSVEVYAMREIADIVYDSPVCDTKSLPIAGSLEVKSDYPTQLKMQLVGLSAPGRIKWLLNDLAHKKALTPNSDYEIQLAEDFGIPAGKAAVALLAQMDGHRDEYKPGGFDALIRIVYASGYQDAQVQEHFLNDPDPSIAHSAYVGINGTGIVGY